MSISNMKSENKRRLAIYATYDKEGKIDDYIFYCLNELKKIVRDIVVVSNNKILSNDRSRLSFVESIYERDDEGFDMGGFAHVINILFEQHEIEKYEEIIFMNDSVFGPVYPFSEMFSIMNQREDIDFWGITKRGISDFDGGDEIYPEHIQLYFYVVRKRMLHSQEFCDYWKYIPSKVTDFRSAILNYEFEFTKYFEDKGYKWDVYCHADNYMTDNPKLNLSPYHYCSYQLIKDMRCPLLKRKLFTGDFIEGKYSDKSDLNKTISYIEKYTDYNVDLIWSHILRVYHLEDIIESMQMYKIIDEGNNDFVQNSSQIRVIDFGGHVEKCSDFEITVSDKAEYSLFISIKENSKIPQALRDAEERCVIENILVNNQYISKVIDLFYENSRLGVMVPPMNSFGRISNSIEQRWQDETVVTQMQNKYHLSVPISKRAPIHKISAFWCRSNILNADLLNDLKNDLSGTVMQMIPLFAQQKGYYTEILVNKTYFATILTNMQRMIHDIWSMSYIELADDANIEEMRDEIYKREIEKYIKKKDKLYVYGAGQLACRIVRIVDTMRKLDGIVVSDKNGNSKMVCGYPIMCIDEVEQVSNCSFIVAVGRKNNRSVEDKLKALQVTDYLLLA